MLKTNSTCNFGFLVTWASGQFVLGDEGQSGFSSPIMSRGLVFLKVGLSICYWVWVSFHTVIVLSRKIPGQLGKWMLPCGFANERD